MSLQDAAMDADAGDGGDDASQAGPPSPRMPPSPTPGPPASFLAATSRSRPGQQPSAPGMGNQADSIVKITAALRMIQEALPGLPQGGPLHKAALKAANGLAKYAAEGQPSAGVQRTMMGDMAQGTMRNQLLQKILGARGGQQGGAGPGPGAAGGGAGAPGGGAGAPAIPLPGA